MHATSNLQDTNEKALVALVSAKPDPVPVLQPGCQVHRALIHMSGLSMQPLLTSRQACGVTWSQVQWVALCTVPPHLSTGTAGLPSAPQPVGQPARHCPGRGSQCPPASAAREPRILTQPLKSTNLAKACRWGQHLKAGDDSYNDAVTVRQPQIAPAHDGVLQLQRPAQWGNAAGSNTLRVTRVLSG